jgi:hypothetical protein
MAGAWGELTATATATVEAGESPEPSRPPNAGGHGQYQSPSFPRRPDREIVAAMTGAWGGLTATATADVTPQDRDAELLELLLVGAI